MNAEEIIKFIRRKDESFWLRLRQRRPLALFHQAAVRVPAYKDWLRRQRIDHKKIKTWQDFQSVPPVSKKNYLRQYPLEKLCWDGNLAKPMVYSATSGSTGQPFYFPRSQRLDWESSIVHELFYINGRPAKNEPTLVLVCFGMGVWIGGLITYKAFEILAQRGPYPISILAPGINETEIFHALKRLAPQYKQTILIGYPPFIKDIVDKAPRHGINIKTLHIRFLFATEGFSESYRDYMAEKAGIKNLYLDTLNIYGSADIGTMAFETPAAILARRLAARDQAGFIKLFSQIEKTPTLAQYNPLFTTFEASAAGEIYLTGNNNMPLIRYAIGDNGGVLSYSEVVNHFKEYGINFHAEAVKAGIGGAITELPFVYVYERSDFSTKLYGATVHTEHVRAALQDSSVADLLTGKMSMLTKHDQKHNQYLEINIELKPLVKANVALKNKTAKVILRQLLQKNSEYRNNYNSMGRRVAPKLVFWPAGHPRYFNNAAKQKWVIK